MKIQKKFVKYQDGGKNDASKKVFSAEEIGKMSNKELVAIMNKISANSSKNADLMYKGMIIGNTANTIKLIRDEMKNRMPSPKPGAKGMKYDNGGKVKEGKEVKKVLTDAEASKAYKEKMANKSKKTGKFEYGGKVKKAG